MPTDSDPDADDHDRTGRPTEHDRYLDVLRELYEAGHRDAFGGGVHPSRVADELDVATTVVRDHPYELEAAGCVKRVRGTDPETHRPRDSFKPLGGDA
jgi:hypothetical protein